VTRPDLPQCIATLIAASGAVNPATQNISIVEVMAQIGAFELPSQLPPLVMVNVVVGGMPGQVYTTKYRVFDPQNHEIASVAGFEIPFTTQIKRANLVQALLKITQEQVVKDYGTYAFEFLVRDEVLARTTLDIIKAEKPPQLPAPNQ
jgi:hypothetical protein